ncbi:LysR substrate-binding domain-containing protein [Bordetella sp. H567]|uniref:LysR substrate-binding domain-containing protein n=1 Tax=Bordetella sp. H567 TaxID=1697043 RepID=UPI00082D546A|nr:LysR substrate-binding domain-containing protein [Bordetella sp. H567]
MHKLRNILGPLRVLDAVNRAGGVARAAHSLHVTPGAVSHQIRALEVALDTRLCRKEGREAVLTPSGLQLATRVAELFDRVEEAVHEATSLGRTRRVRLKVIPSFAIKWLMPRLAGFYAAHGDIDLEVATVTRADDVSLGDADFVVRRGHGRWPGLHADPLFDDVLALACVPSMAATIHHPRDVLEHKLLHSMIAPVSWEAWLAQAGLSPAGARLVPLANAALCLQAAVQGAGIALTQQAYMREEVAREVLVHPLEAVLRSGESYYLVSAPGTLDIRPCGEFAAWVRGVA